MFYGQIIARGKIHITFHPNYIDLIKDANDNHKQIRRYKILLSFQIKRNLIIELL